MSSIFFEKSRKFSKILPNSPEFSSNLSREFENHAFARLA